MTAVSGVYNLFGNVESEYVSYSIIAILFILASTLAVQKLLPQYADGESNKIVLDKKKTVTA